MYKRLSFLVSFVLVLSLVSTTYGIVIGNFENPGDPNHDGWIVYDDPCSSTDPNVSVSYSDTNGVTLGSRSLKIVADKGRQRALVYNVVNNGKVNAFMSNDHIKIDITRLTKDWTVETCSPWSRVYLVILAGSDPCDPNAWELLEQLEQVAGWSPPYSVGDYSYNPGGDVNIPLTRTYYYSHLLPNIDLDNLEYLNIILVTDYDPNYITGGVYYIDNVQMLGTPPTADILLGNFEDQNDGWISVGDANITRTYSTTGATLGLKSLRMHTFGNHPGENDCTNLPSVSGWDNALEYVVPQSLFDEFLSSNSISIDITRLASEWTGDPNVANFSQFFLCLMSNYGWYTVLSGVAMWVPAQGDQTITFTYHYPEYMENRIVPEGLNWLQIWLCTNYDWDYITGGVYYIDNVRMHVKAVTEAFAPNPADGATNVQCDPTLNWKPGKYADKHDVYFGTDKAAVNDANRTNDPCGVLVKQNHDSNSIDITDLVGTLQSDTTYYWRIDNVYGEDIWQGSVWSFTVEPSFAYNPNPSNGDVVSVVPVLSWTAGTGAVKGHVVFFGDDYNEVNDAPKGTSGSPPFRAFLDVADTNWLPPGAGLAPPDANITYYWRIDEVQSTSPQIIHKGDIWNFTTILPANAQGFAITYYDNYNYATGQWDAWGDYNTPLYVWNDEYLVNFTSGKTEATSHYLNSIDKLDLRGGFTSLDVPPHYSSPPYPNDEDWNPLKSIGDDVSGQSPHHVFAAIFTGWVYFEEGDLLSLTSDDDSYIFLDDDTEWGEEILSVPHMGYFEYYDSGGYVELTIPAELAGYHWMTVKFTERCDYYSGIQINLNGEPLQAAPSSSKPSPANKATDVVRDPTLSWLPWIYADKHDVYFGTNKAAVTDANRTSNPCGVLVKQDHDSNSIYIADFVGTLQFDTTYYWRIDDINMAGPDPCIWKGPVWSFTTASYQVMDDFEGYTDLTIGDAWHISGGADVTTSTDVNGQIHSGDEAMAIGYDNDSPPYYSEVYTGAYGAYSLDFDSDWFPKGVKILSLWFHGVPDLRGSYTGADPYSVTGDGSGINNTKCDSFYYLYRQANQITGRVQARVDSVECGMTGVMIRDSLNADSVYAATVVTPDGRVIFMGRGNAGGNSSAIATVSGIAIPHWVRIKRSGTLTMVVAEHSSDGSTWTQIGPSLPWPLTSPIDLGLCVTSNSYGQMCTAEFSNVEMQSPYGTNIPDPNVGKDIGIPYNDPEPMYVGLEDNSGNSAFVSYPYPDATQIGVWTRWLINLNDFTDVNLADVRKMYIGFGDRNVPTQGGSGMMFIDDIRLLALCFPECHPDYAKWVAAGKPDCWCYPKQCHGDADDTSEYVKDKGYYYVHFKDMGLLLSAWNTREPPQGPGLKWPDPNICADFDHNKEYIKGKGYYRVHFKDMGILLAGWSVKEPPQGSGIDPNCLDCP